jgi:hypothetical protein
VAFFSKVAADAKIEMNAPSEPVLADKFRIASLDTCGLLPTPA